MGKLREEEEVIQTQSYECTECRKNFASFLFLQIHNQQIHSDNLEEPEFADNEEGDENECQICKKKFQLFILLQKHMEECCPVYICSTFPSKFESEQSLKNHFEQCQLSITSKLNLNSHEELVEKVRQEELVEKTKQEELVEMTKQENFQISKISKKEGSKQNCETCHDNFETKTILQIHQKIVHENIKTFFTCQQCDAIFTNKKKYIYNNNNIDDTNTF